MHCTYVSNIILYDNVCGILYVYEIMQVPVDGETVKSSELFSDELSLTELKVHVYNIMYVYHTCRLTETVPDLMKCNNFQHCIYMYMYITCAYMSYTCTFICSGAPNQSYICVSWQLIAVYIW